MPNNTIQKSEENLCQLADYLLENRRSILSDWKIRATGDAKLEVTDSLSRKEFFDHVPQILDHFDEELRRPRDGQQVLESLTASSHFSTHGLSRWQQGFSIAELVRDWNHLRCAILRSITAAATERPDWVGATFAAAVNLLSDLVAEGINQSVSKFEEIRQAEARSRMIDLRSNIDELQDIYDRQAALYRDASHDLAGHLGILSSITSVFQSRPESPDLARLYEPLSQGLGLATEILEDVKLQATLESRQAKLFSEEIDLVDSLSDTLAPYLILAKEKSIDLEVSGTKSLCFETDSAKLARIVQNLMHNALKFTTKGAIRVEWGLLPESEHCYIRIENHFHSRPSPSSLPLGEQMVKATFASESQNHQSAESDSDAAATQRPQAPSETGRADSLGVSREGLGLSIAKRLANLLGGKLEIELVNQQKGVRAQVILPLQPPQTEASAHGRPPAEKAANEATSPNQGREDPAARTSKPAAAQQPARRSETSGPRQGPTT